MRSRSAASLSTARRVLAQRSTRPLASACGRELGCHAREQRRQRDAGALRCERTGLELRQVEQLRELRLQRVDGALDIADQRSPWRVARARREYRRIQPQRMQRLPQVVACGRKQLALGAIRGLGGSARFVRRARLALEPIDQVDVFVTDGQRPRQHVVEVMPERQNESEHDAHDQRGERMDVIGDQRLAQDQRHQCRDHEPVERRLVHGREIEAAQAQRRTGTRSAAPGATANSDTSRRRRNPRARRPASSRWPSTGPIAVPQRAPAATRCQARTSAPRHSWLAAMRVAHDRHQPRRRPGPTWPNIGAPRRAASTATCDATPHTVLPPGRRGRAQSVRGQCRRAATSSTRLGYRLRASVLRRRMVDADAAARELDDGLRARVHVERL